MSKKKLQKFCQLTQAIESRDPDFFHAIDDLCVTSLLRPGLTGVTFLYPDHKDVRKTIIDATYSKTPEAAVSMVKALILNGLYKSADEISNATNRLNQIVNTTGGSWGPFEIKQADDISYFDHRGNISMLLLTGKGAIPTKGEHAPRKEKTTRSRKKDDDVVVGGSLFDDDCWPSARISLAKKLAYHYTSEKNKKSNVYTKKVWLQLRILQADHPEIYNSDKVYTHLGNEEISDSYLLDMITPESVLSKIWKAFGSSSNGLGELSEDIHKSDNKSYYEKYLAAKEEVIRKGRFKDDASVVAELKNNLEEQKRLLNNIVAVCDIREALALSYRNKKHLGKDLFIVYTSIMKEMWETEFDMESFKHYTYMAINIYTCTDSMVNQEFNQFKDATLHGNLLKSDVFKFIPWVDPKVYADAGYTTGIYPKPIDLRIYSLNNLISSITTKKTGGNSNSILSQYS